MCVIHCHKVTPRPNAIPKSSTLHDISGHFIHDGQIPAHDPLPPTPISILLLQATSRKQSVQDTEISPVSKLFLWFCIFAHLGGFCIFLYNANLKMQDTDVKGFCYHLLFLKFSCLGGNSYMLNKSLFERHSLLRTYKCSSKKGKWSSDVLMRMEDLKRSFPFRWLVSQQLKIPPCIMSPLVTLWSSQNAASGIPWPIKECTFSVNF